MRPFFFIFIIVILYFVLLQLEFSIKRIEESKLGSLILIFNTKRHPGYQLTRKGVRGRKASRAIATPSGGYSRSPDHSHQLQPLDLLSHPDNITKTLISS